MARSTYSSGFGAKSGPKGVLVLDENNSSKLENSHKLPDGETVGSYEVRMLANHLIPGFNRSLMPEVPEKSSLVRSAELP